MNTPQPVSADLPVPRDDGAARHLAGARMPDISLAAADGSEVNFARLSGRTVVFAYPRTGEPGKPAPDGWAQIPGASGCTPQSCAFRDHFAELRSKGADQVFGLSVQTTDYQNEAAQRLKLPFPLVSDADFKLARSLKLPMFEAAGMILLKRLALIIDDGVISKVFYRVFPPEKNAEEVLAWLAAHPR
jgi:peroxiredoxin